MRTSRIAQAIMDMILCVPADSSKFRGWKAVFLALGLLRRTAIIVLRDPLIRYSFEGKQMLLPLSHELPLIRRMHPGYSKNIARISEVLLAKYPEMSMVDIGANIGDTVAIVRRLAFFPILCIDGDQRFISLLRKNTEDCDAVHVVNCFVGDGPGSIAARVITSGGTSRIVPTNETVRRVETKTLSSILDAHPRFQSIKLIKVDTDGFDTKIIKSEFELLANRKPVVFIEYDPHLFKKNDDHGFGIFNFLRNAGYVGAIFFENTGKFHVRVDLGDVGILEDMHHFYSDRGGRRYCDVCFFAAGDADLMAQVREREISGVVINS